MGGTQIWLEPGEQLSLDEMLKAIAVGSANDCAVAVAEHLAGTEAAFVERMNAARRRAGLHRHDSSSTPTGWIRAWARRR